MQVRVKALMVTPFVALLVTGEALAAERRPQGSGVVVRGAAGLGGPAFSAAAGYELASPRAIPVSIEAYIRASTSDFEFTSRLYGVQLVASWYQRK